MEERSTHHGQTIKARYNGGVLEPGEPLAIAGDAEMQVRVETTAAISADEILCRAADVYHGLTTQEIAQIEVMAFKPSHGCVTGTP